jgi:hypothetical protein
VQQRKNLDKHFEQRFIHAFFSEKKQPSARSKHAMTKVEDSEVTKNDTIKRRKKPKKTKDKANP